LEVWQGKELAADFADVWQIKDLGTVASDDWPMASERSRRGSPLRCMRKSAEVVDEKGVASLHWVQRVWKLMKIKGLDAHNSIGEC